MGDRLDLEAVRLRHAVTEDHGNTSSTAHTDRGALLAYVDELHALVNALLDTAPLTVCSRCHATATRWRSGPQGTVPICDRCQPRKGHRIVAAMPHAAAFRALSAALGRTS